MRPRTAGLAAATATLAVTTVVLVDSPAAPGARDLSDARGDTWSWSPTNSTRGTWGRSSVNANVDVVRVSVRQTEDDVVVRLQYADLRKQGAAFGVALDLRTDEDVHRHVSFVASSGNGWFGRTRLLDRRRQDVACARMHAHASYRRDRIRLTLPRTCVARPGWIQFRAMTYRKDGERLLVDNPHGARPLTRRWSPKVPRG